MAQATNDFNGVITLLAGAVVGVAITFGVMNGMNASPRLPSELTFTDALVHCQLNHECVDKMMKEGHVRVLSTELFVAPTPSYPGTVSNPLPNYPQVQPSPYTYTSTSRTFIQDCVVIEDEPKVVKDPDKD